jgi:hypothetical protein
MEHRYDPRIDIQNNILIHVNRSTFVSGVTRDISYGGLALESAHVQHLNKNALVRAAFMADGELVILPSQVVRVGDNDAALMFIEQASSRKRNLNAWLDDAVRAQMDTSVAEAEIFKHASA